MLLFESHSKNNISKKDTFYKANHTHTAYQFPLFLLFNIEFYVQRKKNPSPNMRKDLSFLIIKQTQLFKITF